MFDLYGIIAFIESSKSASSMTHKAPGKAYRKGISLVELFRKFPDDETAEKWFIENRWKAGVECPKCGSHNIQQRTTRKPQPFRCRSCRKDFSVKTDSIMHNSRLGYQTWAIAIFLLTTNLKGVSSMKLHRDLKITQKSAWHLMHRLRKTFEVNGTRLEGIFEVDETYIGGFEKNKHESQKLKAGRGTVGKTAVVGAKHRASNQVTAKVIENTDKSTLHDFIRDHVEEGSKVFTDDHKSYRELKNYYHQYVTHSAGEYVNEQAHINGIESFWAMLKRAQKGTFHKFSVKHLDKYVLEFSGRHNIRELDTIDQMERVVRNMAGKRLEYKELVCGIDGRLNQSSM